MQTETTGNWSWTSDITNNSEWTTNVRDLFEVNTDNIEWEEFYIRITWGKWHLLYHHEIALLTRDPWVGFG